MTQFVAFEPPPHNNNNNSIILIAQWLAKKIQLFKSMLLYTSTTNDVDEERTTMYVCEQDRLLDRGTNKRRALIECTTPNFAIRIGNSPSVVEVALSWFGRLKMGFVECLLAAAAVAVVAAVVVAGAAERLWSVVSWHRSNLFAAVDSTFVDSVRHSMRRQLAMAVGRLLELD